MSTFSRQNCLFTGFVKENTILKGETQVFVILLSFCDLVHFQSVVHVFAKRLNIALNVH